MLPLMTWVTHFEFPIFERFYIPLYLPKNILQVKQESSISQVLRRKNIESNAAKERNAIKKHLNRQNQQ